jgi:hypothetical protein
MRQSSANSSATGPFWNLSKLLDEAKLAMALSIITTTSAHVPHRKMPSASKDDDSACNEQDGSERTRESEPHRQVIVTAAPSTR